NARLTKLYTESLNNFAEQLENHAECQRLKEELWRRKDEYTSKEEEHRKAMELLKKDHAKEVADLEAKVRKVFQGVCLPCSAKSHWHRSGVGTPPRARHSHHILIGCPMDETSKASPKRANSPQEFCFCGCKYNLPSVRGLLLEKATNEATIIQLRKDLATHKSHAQVLSKKLDQLQSDEESKYLLEIWDLKDCLLIEQEEKNELTKKLQEAEKECKFVIVLISRTKLGEQQQDSSSNQQVETLKLKIMKLRKENEILKRKLSSMEAC
ncbi:hypothetical protein Godav_012900, partial [Gossypium davidsonii]|nr:hypothetical protein [Gossypium davidsonii]MBA0647414.1 hypothetical protein [Gossypium klotzschianum]